MESNLITLAKQLMACPSITPHDAGCQDILIQRLKQLGFSIEDFSKNQVSNFYARLGNQSPLLLFAGHTDVVPPGDHWTTPPFSPDIRNGFLYGRGATDMKGAIAAMLIACERFLKFSPQFKGSIGFLITSDEEGAAEYGTAHVVEKLIERQEKIDYCIIGEASSEKYFGDQIRVGRRGSLHGNVIFHGKQGHVAYPERAQNPIHLALPVLNQLATESWDAGSSFFPPTSFQFTKIDSDSGAANVIPGELRARFNFRFSNAISIEEIQARTQALFKKQTLAYSLEWKIGAHPFLSPQGKLISATVSAIEKMTGLQTHLSTGGGTSDGRFIVKTGAEIVELGVLNDSAHAIDECVHIQDLEKLSQCYEFILKKLLKEIEK